MPTSLSVLDLVPVSSGSTARQALLNSIDLARRVERAGYGRYWFAEHHLNPGVAGTSPVTLLGASAAATSSIRLGSAALQMGHRTALAAVEEFGLLDALHPGRFDLGLGRSGGRLPAGPAGGSETSGPSGPSGPTGMGGPGGPGAPDDSGGPGRVRDGRTENGLVIPPPFSFERLLKSPRLVLQKELLTQPHAEPQGYAEQVDDVLALLAGTYTSTNGQEAHVVPGEGAAVQPWIFGSSGGESAEVAGSRGLRFGANYHVAPAGVIDAVTAYRAAFKASADLDEPYVAVSADVVVAEDEATARELATGYALWVRSIRTGEGAIPFPSPDEARQWRWTEEDRALVQDRLDTQFVGSPAQVADQLERLRDATGADELALTTITHRHADRVTSYELIADEWRRRQG